MFHVDFGSSHDMTLAEYLSQIEHVNFKNFTIIACRCYYTWRVMSNNLTTRVYIVKSEVKSNTALPIIIAY